jgi:hypothetical protein
VTPEKEEYKAIDKPKASDDNTAPYFKVVPISSLDRFKELPLLFPLHQEFAQNNRHACAFNQHTVAGRKVGYA